MVRAKSGRRRVKRGRRKVAEFMGLTGDDMSQFLIAPKRKMRTAKSWALVRGSRQTSRRLSRGSGAGRQSLD